MTNSIHYMIKPTSKCNFDCAFCSAKKLDIPMHEHVPEVLKNYIIENKIDHLGISGGEPLINPISYLEELLQILDDVNQCKPYEMGITSNMVLWYENPAKYDNLFKNPHVLVETSFQYGGERKDSTEFTEERFLNIYKMFYERYGYPLCFVYVISEKNEQYILKACELAKRIGTKLSISPQLPLGVSETYYPRYKLLETFMKIIDAGYADQVHSLNKLFKKCCPFVDDPMNCLHYTKSIYVGNDGQIHEHICDNMLTVRDPVTVKEPAIFPKCYGCKLFRLCNGCPIEAKYLKDVRENHCHWMKTHYNELREYGFIDEEF